MLPKFDKGAQTVFYVLGTYLATSAMIGTLYAFGARFAGREAMLFLVCAMLVPGVVALGLWKLVVRKPLAELGLPPRLGPWYLLALALPALAKLGAMGLASLVGAAFRWDLGRLLGALPAGASINAALALASELGWRGYLSDTIDEPFWKKSLLIGAIWGVWYMPLVLIGYNDVGHVLLSVPMTIAFCIAWAPAFQALRERGGSVIACAVMHGTLNTTASVGVALAVSGPAWLVGPTGVAAIAAGALTSLVLGTLGARARIA